MDAEVFDGEDIHDVESDWVRPVQGNGWRIRPVGAWFDRRAGALAEHCGRARCSHVITMTSSPGRNPSRAGPTSGSNTNQQSARPFVALACAKAAIGHRRLDPPDRSQHEVIGHI